MINEIDLRTIPCNVPSLCIPRVFTNITEEMIRKIFEDLELGIIERIDIVKKYSQTGQFNRIFIHFKKWFSNNGNANSARQRLLSGNEIKIIYDEPWFWKVSAYRDPGLLARNTSPNIPICNLSEVQEQLPHPPKSERPKTFAPIEKRMIPPQVTKIFKKQKQIKNCIEKMNDESKK
jgi:hypothetical protein